MEAGLPSWRQLIRNIGEHADDKLIRLIELEEPDLKRNAQMIMSLESNEVPYESKISQALYGKEQREPRHDGQLIKALAELVKKLGGRVQVVTTNYDDCFENALKDIGVTPYPFGLRDKDKWEKCCGENVVGILHVHGFIPRNSSDKGWSMCEPIILTEGSYISSAGNVQKIIREQAEKSHCIFIGSSLSDSNIMNPFSRNYEKSEEKDSLLLDSFALIVPDDRNAYKLFESVSSAKEAEKGLGRGANYAPDQFFRHYFEQKIKFIEKEFFLNVVQLKSYGQLAQCVQEARIALLHRDSYLEGNEEYSLRYGYRFSRIMRNIHERLAVVKGRYAPCGSDSLRLCAYLAEQCNLGPIRYLENFPDFREYFDDKESYSNYFKTENLALYLWLRSLATNAEESAEEYEIFLAATSVYSLHDSVAMTQRLTISRRSEFVAARSVYSGSSFLLAPHDIQKSSRWRSFLAFPISISEKDLGISASDGGDVTVGSIVLQTNKEYSPGKREEAEKMGKSERPHYLSKYSVLSLLNSKRQQELADKVIEAGRNAIVDFQRKSLQ